MYRSANPNVNHPKHQFFLPNRVSLGKLILTPLDWLDKVEFIVLNYVVFLAEPSMTQLNGMNRRRFLAGFTAAASVGYGLTQLANAKTTQKPANHQEVGSQEQQLAADATAKTLIDKPAQAAINRGLKFLVNRQIKSGPERGGFGSSGYECGVAVASLSGLAMMCGGSAPGDGPYGDEVNRCVEFVLQHVNDAGYISRSDGRARENMYGHGFSMLFLSEAYGMTQKSEIAEKLRKAVNLTCNTQNSQGGWRYGPSKQPSADLSITVCQIMGLRAARDAGIHVPDEVRSKCIEYVKNSQNENGSFRYQMSGGHSTFAMTAAGITSLYSAGIYDSEQVKKGLENLASHQPGRGTHSGHYFYGHYYAVQAMWHAGGEYWQNWYPAIRDELIKRQATDGSWSGTGGPSYGAAMACIILQIPLNFLPVFSP